MINAIIEVKRDHHGESRRRLLSALNHIREDLGVFDYHLCADGEPTDIPDFGHDHKCQCQNPEPYGVHRYFNLYLEWPTFDRLLGSSITLNENVQLIPCGKTL